MFHKNRMAYEDDMVKSLHMPFLSQISLFSHIILSSKDRSCHAALFSLFLLVQHLPCVSGTKSIGFLSFCFWSLFLRVNNATFEYRSFLQVGWSFLLRDYFRALFSRIHLQPPFPCAQRMWIFHISFRTFCWRYWHIWNWQQHILPLHL